MLTTTWGSGERRFQKGGKHKAKGEAEEHRGNCRRLEVYRGGQNSQETSPVQMCVQLYRDMFW